MPFTIDEDNLLIKGRKGDTGSFTFNFNQDMSAYTVTFGIVEDVGDTTAIIEKEFVNPSEQSVTVNLLTTDTELLNADGDSPKVYYWYLKISAGSSYAETLIPQAFDSAPQLHVYPEVYGGS